MFLLDSILTSPIRGIGFIFREIHQAALSELPDRPSIVQELQELYMRLETGKVSEEEFQQREATLLDRLDEVERNERGASKLTLRG